jgi:hypothetical protein
LLTFPSLCRGGLHYAELISSETTRPPSVEPIDVVAHSERLAADLRALLVKTAEPGVARLVVDLAGADGTETLLQPDFRSWLSDVMRISMEPLPAGNEYLVAASSVCGKARAKGGSLVVPADTVPSIAALVAPAAPGSSDEVILPLLIADADPSQPVKRVEMPPISSPVLHAVAEGFRPTWPRFVPSGRSSSALIDVGAIRCGRRSAPNDAELLLPLAADAPQVRSDQQAITWLVFQEDWDEDVLAESLQLLALQDGADRSAVVLVGEETPSLSVAERLFGNRVCSSPDLPAALQRLDTPLAGYLGAHVLLHDRRTSAVLGRLLENPAVVSSSCVLISTEKRGKGWQVSIADTGTFGSGKEHDNSLAERSSNAQLLWRTTYPTLRPPRDLWVGRAAAVPGWLQRAGPLRSQEGIHACTSLVTASYGRSRDDRPAHLAPPAAAAQRAVRMEALFG